MSQQITDQTPGLSQRKVTTNEIADACRVTPQTVRLWVRQGLIPAPIRVGKQLLFSTAVLDDLLAGRLPARKG